MVPQHKSHRRRTSSFHDLDTEQATGVLSDLLKEEDVYLGGSAIGKGLERAAMYYLGERMGKKPKPVHLDWAGSVDLNPECDQVPLEEPFYILDLGMVVSQVYQWRKFFPRIEPFYAVKCNPDPVIVKTLASLGCHFDCASRNEIKLVQEVTQDLPRSPEIIYANPCKARAHLIEAVCRGVRMVTFDNVNEVKKISGVSKSIKLVMRIITDDRGSQCRFSTKFGAPRNKWRPLLACAKANGLEVVGVSFHVGSGCRDASKYELALRDAREIFDMAKTEFGFTMNILDIGGGFPGETHSQWNPADEIDNRAEEEDEDDISKKEGTSASDSESDDEKSVEHFMFFREIADTVAPLVDKLFPVESGVRVIAEPGRYLVAACATLCCSVVAVRDNCLDTQFEPEAIDDREAAKALHKMSRNEEKELVHHRATSSFQPDATAGDNFMETIKEELEDYNKLYARQQLAQQEFDVYNDQLDLCEEGFETAIDLLGPPEPEHMDNTYHTAEGMAAPLVNATSENPDNEEPSSFLTLASSGEAAVSGVMLQAVADASGFQDDYTYYINDGVYGAFNNLMFDHAHVRPRLLMRQKGKEDNVTAVEEDGFLKLESEDAVNKEDPGSRHLYASTVFGPTCDSIDVISRSVLLPKLEIGDWMYFQNMGAYTMAAASAFNGFIPSYIFYVCSVQPEYFEGIIKGPEEDIVKKEEDSVKEDNYFDEKKEDER